MHACHEYEICIATSNAFPESMQHIEWAKACWANAHHAAGIDELYKFTDHMRCVASYPSSLDVKIELTKVSP